MGIIRTRTRGANSSLDGACSCAATVAKDANNTARHAAPDFFPVILNMPRNSSVWVLLLYCVNSHFRALSTASWDGQEEAMHPLSQPSKIPGRACAQCSGNFGEEAVMIRVGHLKNVDEPLSSGHIPPLMLGVIVEIIRILGAGQRRDHVTRCSVEYSQSRRFAYADK